MPSEIVQVVHPAVLAHMPPRCREIRHTLVRVDTPVRLRSIPWSDTGEGPTLPVGRDRLLGTRMVEGDAWRVVGDDGYLRERGRPPSVSAATFRDWLAGTGMSEDRRDQSETMRCLSATPLVGRLGHNGTGIRPLARMDATAEGRIVRDLRDEARAALARHFETDVAIVGGVPMVRLRGPVAQLLVPRRRGFVGARPEIAVSRYPGSNERSIGAQGLYHRVDRAASLRRGHDGEGATVSWDDALVRSFPWSGVDDVWLSVHEILNSACHLLVRRPDVTWIDEDVRERALSLAERTATHLPGVDELPEACEVAAALCRGRYRWAGREEPDAISCAGSHLRYVTEVAMPILASERRVEPEDASALEGLAPVP